MDFLKAQLERIRQQLSGLSASQRMLAATLVVIMGMTLVWWTGYAGKAELDSLTGDQALKDDQIAPMTRELARSGIPFKVMAGKVMVPSDRKLEAISNLTYAQAMPLDTVNVFDDLVSKTNPFDPPKKTDAIYNEILQQKLGQVLARWPRVSRAVVLVHPARVRGPNGFDPTASVNITMQEGEAGGDQLANSAAAFVAGAAGVKRESVTVIINSIEHRIHGQDDQDSGENAEAWLAMLKKTEQYYSHTLEDHFRWLPGTMVAVRARQDLSRRVIDEKKLDPKNVVQKQVSEQTSNEDNHGGSKPAEAGITSNAPLAAGDVPAGDTSSNTVDTSKSEYVVQIGGVETHTNDPGGQASVVSASVLIPRSYFVRLCRERSGSTDEPKDELLTPFIDKEINRLKLAALHALGLSDKDKDSLTMSWYPDAMPSAVAGPQVASTSAMPMMIVDHVKEIAIGVLALISLLMVSNMVRKATPAPVVAAYEAPRPVAPLGIGDEAIGEAIEGTQALDGVELDPDSAKAQQILTQVSEMVSANPDSAAALVKRWLNRT